MSKLCFRVIAPTHRYGLARVRRDERAEEVAFLYSIPVQEVIKQGFTWRWVSYPADPKAAVEWAAENACRDA